MLLWKKHEKENKCLRCGKTRYIKDINDEGKIMTIEVAHKQHCYVPISSKLKRLFLSNRMDMHMQWHKEGEGEDKEVMVHLSDGDA